MISNPNLILYACIAKGPLILAEFSSKEPGIESLAQKCIEKTPPHHSMFSHTVSKRTYTFLIDNAFAYFAIAHQKLDKSETLWFLNRLKCAFEDFLEDGLISGTDNLTSNCLQSHFNPVFCEILDLELVAPPTTQSEDCRNPSLDSTKGKRMVVAPLLGKPNKWLKKKKRSSGEPNGDAKDGGIENKMDLSEAVNCASREFPVCTQKGASFYAPDRQKAKQVWRKHVLVVLILDLVVCAALFGIWLWVCRGFQCIDG